MEEALVDEATAALDLDELRAEVATLERLEALGDRVRRSGTVGVEREPHASLSFTSDSRWAVPP